MHDEHVNLLRTEASSLPNRSSWGWSKLSSSMSGAISPEPKPQSPKTPFIDLGAFYGSVTIARQTAIPERRACEHANVCGVGSQANAKPLELGCEFGRRVLHVILINGMVLLEIQRSVLFHCLRNSTNLRGQLR